MNQRDFTPHIDRVAFEEADVKGTGRIESFEADVNVEFDGGSYVFIPTQIYTHQKVEGGFAYRPAKMGTDVQQGIELALREHILNGDGDKELIEAADEAGLRPELLRAA